MTEVTPKPPEQQDNAAQNQAAQKKATEKRTQKQVQTEGIPEYFSNRKTPESNLPLHLGAKLPAHKSVKTSAKPHDGKGEEKKKDIDPGDQKKNQTVNEGKQSPPEKQEAITPNGEKPPAKAEVVKPEETTSEGEKPPAKPEVVKPEAKEGGLPTIKSMQENSQALDKALADLKKNPQSRNYHYVKRDLERLDTDFRKHLADVSKMRGEGKSPDAKYLDQLRDVNSKYKGYKSQFDEIDKGYQQRDVNGERILPIKPPEMAAEEMYQDHKKQVNDIDGAKSQVDRLESYIKYFEKEENAKGPKDAPYTKEGAERLQRTLEEKRQELAKARDDYSRAKREMPSAVYNREKEKLLKDLEDTENALGKDTSGKQAPKEGQPWSKSELEAKKGRLDKALKELEKRRNNEQAAYDMIHPKPPEKQTEAEREVSRHQDELEKLEKQLKATSKENPDFKQLESQIEKRRGDLAKAKQDQAQEKQSSEYDKATEPLRKKNEDYRQEMAKLQQANQDLSKDLAQAGSGYGLNKGPDSEDAYNALVGHIEEKQKELEARLDKELNDTEKEKLRGMIDRYRSDRLKADDIKLKLDQNKLEQDRLQLQVKDLGFKEDGIRQRVYSEKPWSDRELKAKTTKEQYKEIIGGKASHLTEKDRAIIERYASSRGGAPDGKAPQNPARVPDEQKSEMAKRFKPLANISPQDKEKAEAVLRDYGISSITKDQNGMPVVRPELLERARNYADAKTRLSKQTAELAEKQRAHGKALADYQKESKRHTSVTGKASQDNGNTGGPSPDKPVAPKAKTAVVLDLPEDAKKALGDKKVYTSRGGGTGPSNPAAPKDKEAEKDTDNPTVTAGVKVPEKAIIKGNAEQADRNFKAKMDKLAAEGKLPKEGAEKRSALADIKMDQSTADALAATLQGGLELGLGNVFLNAEGKLTDGSGDTGGLSTGRVLANAFLGVNEALIAPVFKDPVGTLKDAAEIMMNPGKAAEVAIESGKKGLTDIGKGLNDLYDAYQEGDQDKLDTGVQKLSRGGSHLWGAVNAARQGLKTTKALYNTLPKSIPTKPSIIPSAKAVTPETLPTGKISDSGGNPVKAITGSQNAPSRLPNFESREGALPRGEHLPPRRNGNPPSENGGGMEGNGGGNSPVSPRKPSNSPIWGLSRKELLNRALDAARPRQELQPATEGGGGLQNSGGTGGAQAGLATLPRTKPSRLTVNLPEGSPHRPGGSRLPDRGRTRTNPPNESPSTGRPTPIVDKPLKPFEVKPEGGKSNQTGKTPTPIEGKPLPGHTKPTDKPVAQPELKPAPGTAGQSGKNKPAKPIEGDGTGPRLVPAPDTEKKQAETDKAGNPLPPKPISPNWGKPPIRVGEPVKLDEGKAAPPVTQPGVAPKIGAPAKPVDKPVIVPAVKAGGKDDFRGILSPEDQELFETIKGTLPDNPNPKDLAGIYKDASPALRDHPDFQKYFQEKLDGHIRPKLDKLRENKVPHERVKLAKELAGLARKMAEESGNAVDARAVEGMVNKTLTDLKQKRGINDDFSVNKDWKPDIGKGSGEFEVNDLVDAGILTAGKDAEAHKAITDLINQPENGHLREAIRKAANDERNGVRSKEHLRGMFTNPLGVKMAEALGYKKVGEVAGSPLFERTDRATLDGPQFISPDITSHSSLAWKGFASKADAEKGIASGKSEHRLGTFSLDFRNMRR